MRITTSIPTCPVAALAKSINANISEFNDLDREVVGNPTPSAREVWRMEALSNHRFALEHAATALPAQSALGAVLQLLLIMAKADTLASLTPDTAEMNSRADSAQRGIERCAWSVIHFLERNHGVCVEEVAAGYYGKSEHSPFNEAATVHTAEAPPVKGEDIFAAPEQQLVKLVERYDQVLHFYHTVTDAQDDPTLSLEKAELAQIGAGHSVRQLKEISAMIYEIPTVDLRGFGLKARVLAESWAELWDDDEKSLESRERGLRALLTQLMVAGGVNRIERRDFSLNDFIPEDRAA